MNHWPSSTMLQGSTHHWSDSGQEKCSGTAARQLNYSHQCWWHRPWANPHVYGGYSTFQLLKWYKPMTLKPLLWYDSIQIYRNITYSACTKLEKYRIYSKSPSPDLLKSLCPKIKFWNNSTANHMHFKIALTLSIYLQPRMGIKSVQNRLKMRICAGPHSCPHEHACSVKPLKVFFSLNPITLPYM